MKRKGGRDSSFFCSGVTTSTLLRETKILTITFLPFLFSLLSFFRFFFHPPPLAYIPRMAAPRWLYECLQRVTRLRSGESSRRRPLPLPSFARSNLRFPSPTPPTGTYVSSGISSHSLPRRLFARSWLFLLDQVQGTATFSSLR